MVNNFLKLIFVLLVVFATPLKAQIAVGDWREHLPYAQTIAVVEGDQNRIYCATPFSLFFVDRTDWSVQRMSRVTGLSDVSISSINYDEQTSTLIIAYENANIDLLNNDKITNISDIKRKSIIGGKRINSIRFREGKAYLCTAFGIVVLDIRRKEIKDTYYIGVDGKAVNVNELEYDENNFYAATDVGIFRASVNSQLLANFQEWHYELGLSQPYAKYNTICKHQGRLFANLSSSLYAKDTIFVKESGNWKVFDTLFNGPNRRIKSYGDTLLLVPDYGYFYFFDSLKAKFNAYTYNQGPNSPVPHLWNGIRVKDGSFWLADKELSLAHNFMPWNFRFFGPNGPAFANAYSMNCYQGNLWVASGGVASDWDNAWTQKGIYGFVNQKWSSINASNTAAFDSIHDVLDVAINPKNTNNIFVASWGKGLLEFNNSVLTNIYNKTNSSLQESVIYPGFTAVGGLCFDASGNLWMTNSSNPMGLVVRKANGSFKSFSLSPNVNSDALSDLVIDDFNQKWIIMPRGNGILVYNDNKTIDNAYDDRNFKISTAVGQGKLPSASVFCLAVDKKGYVWAGTAKGVVVFYSPENVFTGRNFDAQQIYVPQEGITQYLLESEEVTAIAVDGANKKWFGTRSAGVFYMNEEGNHQIHHFTTDNSPLLSNTIFSIAIDDKTGEVFFGTENGIISWRGYATEGGEKNEDVQVFPNPVRPDFNGYIAVNGLVENASIRIADAGGNLVFKGVAEGGQLVWNGKDFSGNRVQTGVYIVFASNEDGSETAVAKIMFIH